MHHEITDGATIYVTRDYHEAWRHWQSGNLNGLVPWGRDLSVYSLFPRVIPEQDIPAFLDFRHGRSTAQERLGDTISSERFAGGISDTNMLTSGHDSQCASSLDHISTRSSEVHENAAVHADTVASEIIQPLAPSTASNYAKDDIEDESVKGASRASTAVSCCRRHSTPRFGSRISRVYSSALRKAQKMFLPPKKRAMSSNDVLLKGMTVNCMSAR